MGLARIDTLWIRYISEVLHVNSPNGSRPRRWSVKSSSTSAVSRWHRRLHPIPAKAELEASATRGVGRPRAERPRTVSEAAEELGLSVYTVRAWIASRRLAHLRLGRAIRVPAEEVRRIIEQSTVPAERK
jgi:excisionase family DNA binding protein